MVDDKTITDRVEARRLAKVVYDLAVGEAPRLPCAALTTFWRNLLKHICDEQLSPDLHPVRIVERGLDAAMSDQEAKRFEREVIVFGTHSGSTVGDVEMPYLLWLDEQPNFRKKLNRYLRSESVQRMQDDPEGGG